MFSVMYTGINRFPLCTAIVCPTNSGKMTERRDHVRMIRFSVPRFMAATLSNNLPSINGPFFSERATLFSLDHNAPDYLRRFKMYLSDGRLPRVLAPLVGQPHGLTG